MENMASHVAARKRHDSSAHVLESILQSAAMEFAKHGFEGASTRRIAERAGVFQAQLGYHVGTKDELWRSTVDWLFERLRAELEKGLASQMDTAVDDPVGAFADIIRRHVLHTARHPELSKIMAIEASHTSSRSKYLLTNHVKPTLEALRLVWDDVQAERGARYMDAEDVFMLMIGLAPLPFSQNSIMKPLLGRERCTPEHHAETIVKWIIR